MNVNFEELVPDFRPLLSLSLTQDGAGLDAGTGGAAAVSTTLRALQRNPGVLSQATVDYLSVIRDVEVVNNRKRLEKECALLAAKYSDIIAALRAVNDSHLTAQALPSSRHGALARLPVELLTLIFTTSMISVDPEHPERIYEPFDMDMRLVCRRWRDVVDNTPVLWACLNLDCSKIDTDQLRVVLARSKTTPLELRIYVNAVEERLYTILKLRQHINRMRSLTFYPFTSVPGTEYSDEELDGIADEVREALLKRGKYYIEQLMQGSFPLLEAIRIEELNSQSAAFWDVELPSLRHFYMRDCLITTNNLVNLHECHDLTTLILDECAVFRSAEDLLMILTATPNLRVFQWTPRWSASRRLSFNSSEDFDPESIDLPQLERLQLRLRPDILAIIIPLFNLPTSTELHIQGVFGAEPDVDSPVFATLLESLHSAFWPHLQKVFAGNVSGYHRLHIRHFEQYHSSPGFNVTASHDDDSLIPGIPFFKYGVQWNEDSHDVYMATIFELLTWPGMARNITKLEVRHSELIQTANQWARLLGELPALTSVEVSERGAFALLGALDAVASLLEVLPAFHTVSFINPPRDAMAPLVKTLDKRVQEGRPALQLKFGGYVFYWPEDFLLALREHKGVREVVAQ